MNHIEKVFLLTSPLPVPDFLGHAVDAEVVEHAPLPAGVGHLLVLPGRPQLAAVLAVVVDAARVDQDGVSVEEALADEKGAKKKSKAPKAKRNGPKAPAKYRNPNDPKQTWTGRGRRPAWFVSAMADGKTEKDLAI